MYKNHSAIECVRVVKDYRLVKTLLFVVFAFAALALVFSARVWSRDFS